MIRRAACGKLGDACFPEARFSSPRHPSGRTGATREPLASSGEGAQARRGSRRRPEAPEAARKRHEQFPATSWPPVKGGKVRTFLRTPEPQAAGLWQPQPAAHAGDTTEARLPTSEGYPADIVFRRTSRSFRAGGAPETFQGLRAQARRGSVDRLGGHEASLGRRKRSAAAEPLALWTPRRAAARRRRRSAFCRNPNSPGRSA